MRDQTLSLPDDLREAVHRFLGGARSIVDFREAYLFGSRARGDARLDSDVDVAIVAYDLQEDAYTISLRLAEWAADVLLETGFVINPVLIRGEHWDAPERFTNPAFLENVRREGMVL
jgi:predicted nucleotidyltransferase